MGPLKNISSAVGELQKRENAKAEAKLRDRNDSSADAISKRNSSSDKAEISTDARQMLEIRDRAFKLFEQLEKSGEGANPHQLEAIRSKILDNAYQDEEHLDRLADILSGMIGSDMDGNE